jgi:DHA2 family multidrug resistance protein
MSAADAAAPFPGAIDARRPAATSRLLLTVSVMASTVMQALDTTIANVALPHMQGQLGATSDEISWVLTSYLVSAAIMMPLTGYFSDRFGRRRYLSISIAGFVVASMLCGLARNLPEIVMFRLLQGAFGAALVPLAQAIMADAYPPEERGHAMSIWSMGVMVGPIIGPSLGGWLTDALSWRWAFFINLPVGIASLLMVMRFCPDTPLRERKMDWTGLGLLSVAIAGTQMVLDRGNGDDWFASTFISVTAVVAAAAFIAFLFYALTTSRKPVFDITVFKDRNFLASGVVTSIMGLSLFGATFIQPVLLEKLLNYPIATAGLVMVPRGVATMLSMRSTGKLIGRVDTRILVAIGITSCAAGSFAMSNYDLNIDTWTAIWPTLLQGFGLGFIYVPLASLQLATLRHDQIADGAGLASLLRTMGQAIGISITATLLSRFGQNEWNQLGGHLNPYNPALSVWLHAHGVSPGSTMAAPLLAAELGRQAEMLAVLNVLKFIAWSCLAMLLCVPLVKSVGTEKYDPALGVD